MSLVNDSPTVNDSAALRAARIYQENVRETRAHFEAKLAVLRQGYVSRTIDWRVYDSQRAALESELQSFIRQEGELYRLNLRGETA